MSAALPGQSTIAVWGGEIGHEAYERSTQVPVVHSVSFGYPDLDSWRDVALERAPGHISSRMSNPTPGTASTAGPESCIPSPTIKARNEPPCCGCMKA